MSVPECDSHDWDGCYCRNCPATRHYMLTTIEDCPYCLGAEVSEVGDAGGWETRSRDETALAVACGTCVCNGTRQRTVEVCSICGQREE